MDETALMTPDWDLTKIQSLSLSRPRTGLQFIHNEAAGEKDNCFLVSRYFTSSSKAIVPGKKHAKIQLFRPDDLVNEAQHQKLSLKHIGLDAYIEYSSTESSSSTMSTYLRLRPFSNRLTGVINDEDKSAEVKRLPLNQKQWAQLTATCATDFLYIVCDVGYLALKMSTTFVRSSVKRKPRSNGVSSCSEPRRPKKQHQDNTVSEKQQQYHVMVSSYNETFVPFPDASFQLSSKFSKEVVSGTATDSTFGWMMNVEKEVKDIMENTQRSPYDIAFQVFLDAFFPEKKDAAILTISNMTWLLSVYWCCGVNFQSVYLHCAEEDYLKSAESVYIFIQSLPKDKDIRKNVFHMDENDCLMKFTAALCLLFVAHVFHVWNANDSEQNKAVLSLTTQQTKP